MRDRKESKEEWLKYSGWDHTIDDKWFRDRVADLFDLETASESQRHLLVMADLRLTLADLPQGANPNHEAELKALLVKEFGPPPSKRGKRWLFHFWRGRS